ncbi:hypothetical protein [Rothia sp. L_38]|uniref:hypothetical protein n=1 Tax=Rothia sp. L_38 TaxID=3422315 RepID=UPI003D6A6288
MATQQPKPTALLTPDQVARHLAVTTDLLGVLRTRGGGPPFIKVGALVRYHPTSLARWVYEQEQANSTSKHQVLAKLAGEHNGR